MILLFGIFESGSRTVFLLLVFSVLCLCIVLKEKANKIVAASVLLFGTAVVVIYVWFNKDISSVGRFITTSFSESTLLGRILYYKDALPVILKHPFGLGYLGYYFLQRSFQTAVYSVMYIPSKLTTLEFMLFSYCSSLSTITIPGSIKCIENGVFSSCSSLTSIVLPDSVQTIGEWVFSGCTKLKSVVLPTGITEIPNSFFAGCTSLGNITIPNGVTRIGDGAFMTCRR